MKIQVQIIVLNGVAVVDVCLCAISVDAADVVIVIAFNAAASGMYALYSVYSAQSIIYKTRTKKGDDYKRKWGLTVVSIQWLLWWGLARMKELP